MSAYTPLFIYVLFALLVPIVISLIATYVGPGPQSRQNICRTKAGIRPRRSWAASRSSSTSSPCSSSSLT